MCVLFALCYSDKFQFRSRPYWTAIRITGLAGSRLSRDSNFPMNPRGRPGLTHSPLRRIFVALVVQFARARSSGRGAFVVRSFRDAVVAPRVGMAPSALWGRPSSALRVALARAGGDGARSQGMRALPERRRRGSSRRVTGGRLRVLGRARPVIVYGRL